jgi:hypothetical protein
MIIKMDIDLELLTEPSVGRYCACNGYEMLLSRDYDGKNHKSWHSTFHCCVDPDNP